MNEVIRSGVPFVGKEHELILIRNGVDETVFVDFVYEPIKYNGVVDAIMVLAIDVTDKVVARRRVEDMEESVRLAIAAADTGTFDLDIIKGVMVTSPRFNAIFGFDHHVTWDKFVNAIHPDEIRKILWRNVAPVLAAIPRQMNQPII